MPPTLVAPACAARWSSGSIWWGASLMPGISGAIRTPVGIPARFSSATASRRARGLGVCGSVARHAFSSSVGIDRQALNCVRCASSRISSISRSNSGDLVSTEHGLPVPPAASSIASQMPTINR